MILRLPIHHPGLLAVIILAVLALPLAALAAGITRPSHHDPLLDGVVDGPCAGLTGGPGYVPGTDAEGYPMVPADVGAGPVPIPDQMVVPLHRPGAGRHDAEGHDRHGGRDRADTDGPYAVIDGARLAPLLQAPACGQMPPAPPPRR